MPNHSYAGQAAFWRWLRAIIYAMISAALGVIGEHLLPELKLPAVVTTTVITPLLLAADKYVREKLKENMPDQFGF